MASHDLWLQIRGWDSPIFSKGSSYMKLQIWGKVKSQMSPVTSRDDRARKRSPNSTEIQLVVY